MAEKSGKSHKLTLSRRELVGGGAAALSMLALDAGASATTPEKVLPRYVPGVQLYSVRGSMAIDVPGTLKAVAGIGYKEVEFAGYFDQPPRVIRIMLDDLGLSAPSNHMDVNQVMEDPMPLIEAAAEIGHNYAMLAWMRPEDRETIDQYKAWADTFNRLGEACRDAGIRFAFHNHGFEFVPIDGIVPWQVLLDETDPGLVDFELDFFWVLKAGAEVTDVLAMAPERYTMAHIKDMDSEGNMVDVGTGEVDFAAILSDPAAAGLKHLFVEHDEPPDPFRSLAISRYNFSSILGC